MATAGKTTSSTATALASDLVASPARSPSPLAGVVVPGLLTPLGDVVSSLLDYCELQNELRAACHRVRKRLWIVWSALEKGKSETIDDPTVAYFSEVVKDFQAFLLANQHKNVLIRLATSRKTTVELIKFHDWIDKLVGQLDGCDDPDIKRSIVVDASEMKEQFQLFQQSTSDTTKILASVQGQELEEAMALLKFQLEHDNDKNSPEMNDLTKRVLVNLEWETGIKYPDVEDWFVSPYDLERLRRPFESGEGATLHHTMWNDVKVVIKCFLNDTTCVQEKFIEVVNRYSRLDHPNILKLYGASHVGKTPFYILEEATHGNILSYVSQHKSDLWRLLHETALGLRYLHGQGLVHGNVRGVNILLNGDGAAKLSGFGVSGVGYAVTGEPIAEHVVPNRWAAPEMTTNGPSFTSDIYAFGMCIVEVATGRFPFALLPDDEFASRVLKGELLLRPSELSEEQWNLVQRVCHVDPSMRPQMDEVVQKMEVFCNAESQQQSGPIQSVEINHRVDPARSSNDVLSVEHLSPSFIKGPVQPLSVLHQPQHSQEVADRLQEMMNDTFPQMVIFRHLVQRLFTVVTQANAQSVDDYTLRGLTDLVEQVFDSFVIFRRHYHASIIDVLQAPVVITRARAYHLDLEELEQICGLKQQKWEENWYSDCEAFVKLLRGVELEYASGDEEEMDHIEEEIECTAQFIRGKYIESMPPTEKSLMTQLFDKYLTTSDEVVIFQSWFIPMAECQQHPRLPDVHIWNGINVKILRFLSSSKEHQQLCRAHADKMAGLTNPHIVRLLGACDVGVPFFVVENIQSMPLVEYVKEHSPSRDDIWLAIFDVALALHWLHERGVMCGALSSSCIVVEPDGRGRLNLYSPRRDRFGEGELSETQFDRPTTTAADVCNFSSWIREALEPFGGNILDIGQHLLNGMMNEDPNRRPSMEMVVTEMFRLIQPDPQWSPVIESFVAKLEPSAWNDLKMACSPHTKGNELFGIVIGYIERLVETDDPNMPTFLRTSIASYLTFIQQYRGSPAVAQLAQVRHMMQSTQRLLEQVDDFLKQARVEHCQQGVWEKPFSIHCASLVQEWVEWLQDADEVKAIDCDDALTTLTMIKYEWDTHFRVLSDSVQALYRTAFDVVSSEACVCVMTSASWFIPPYQISHSHFNNERVMVKKMLTGSPICEDKDEAASKVVEQASLWAKLYHPNILRFIGANHVGDPYMMFEAGSSTLREKPDDRREIWCRLHEAAMGLEYLHSQGVAHGQLNCEAIITCDGSSFEKDHSVAKLVSTDLVPMKVCYKSGLGTSAIETDLSNFARCIVEAIAKTTIDKDDDDFVAEMAARGLHDQRSNEAWRLVRNMLLPEFGGLSYVIETLARFKEPRTSTESRSPKTKKSSKEILAAMLDDRMMDLKKQLVQMRSTVVKDDSIDGISRQLIQFGAEIALYAASTISTTFTYLALHQKLDKLMGAKEWKLISDSELHNWAPRFRKLTASNTH